MPTRNDETAQAVSEVGAELTRLRKQLAQTGSAALPNSERQLQRLIDRLTQATESASPEHSLELSRACDTLRKQATELAVILVEGDAWCGNLVDMLDCQVQGYGPAARDQGQGTRRVETFG